MILKQIAEEIQHSDKPVVKKLQEAEGGHVLAIGLKHKVLLQEHKSDVPAKILVIKGKIAYHRKEEKTILDLWEEYDIPAGEYHRVSALEDSLFLVIKLVSKKI